MKAEMKVVRFDAEDVIATSSIGPRIMLSDYLNSHAVSYKSFLASEAIEANLLADGEPWTSINWCWWDDEGQIGDYFSDSPDGDETYIWYDAGYWWTEGKTIGDYTNSGLDTSVLSQWRTQ